MLLTLILFMIFDFEPIPKLASKSPSLELKLINRLSDEEKSS